MFVRDPITDTLRLVAPTRERRIGRDRATGCPFCAGNEEATPPERDRITDESGAWTARAVPNLFPLGDVHEVLIPTPRHLTTSRELSEREWRAALRLWQQRLLRYPAGPDTYTHLFINDGKGAGASLPHTHAQLLVVDRWEGTHRLTAGVRGPGCVLCAPSDHGFELVDDRDGMRLLAPPAPRTRGALVLAPHGHELNFELIDVGKIAPALRAATRALPEGDFNAWLVWDPIVDAHWYVELVPRTAIPAGVELGIGTDVCTADPGLLAHEARERIRS